MAQVRTLGPGDTGVLTNVAADVFDRAVDAELAGEFLRDPRHHLAVAVDDGVVVGMASAVHYIHPDKPPELWINEIAVAPTHQEQGLGKRLMRALFALGRDLGCREAWVLTEPSNLPAQRLYQAVGGADSLATMFSFDLTDGG